MPRPDEPPRREGNLTPFAGARLPAAAPERPATLFRPEAIAQRQTQWMGTVLLTPSISHWLITLFAVSVAAAIVAMLVFAQFTRSARINGWLVAPDGMVRVFAPRPGLVGSLRVAEGSHVRKGDPLLTLSDELQSATLGATQAQVMNRLAERRSSLVEEGRQQQRLLMQQQQGLVNRAAALRAEQQQFQREADLLRSRVAIAERAEKLNRQQHEQGYISDLKLQLVESELLEQRARLGALERGRLASERERMGVEAELADLPLKFGKEASLAERSIAQLDQERAEAEARREIVVPAPQDGTVTAIQAVPGARADTGVPLLAIVSADTRLEAHLYSPSRTVGFLRPGQSVVLRYQAFPYQTFGHHEGVVASVSRAALSPGDLPPPLANLGSVTSQANGAAGEPLYRVTVQLNSQSVSAYGASVPLQAGLVLQADVSLQRRRLFEWVLDPLYAIAGRTRG